MPISAKYPFLFIPFLLAPALFAGLNVVDLGKRYDLPSNLIPGLFHHIENDRDVNHGNTSIRNESAETLAWKGTPNANGYGYFQRNRDLGQVFTIPDNSDLTVDAVVIRTAQANKSVMAGAAGAPLYIQFFEVLTAPGKKLAINENGTPQGHRATHGFDHQFNRCDDFVENAIYVPIARASGGLFPNIPPTSHFNYANGKGDPVENQEGHLRYLRFDLTDEDEIKLEAGKRYAFIIGFESPGRDRSFGIAITTTVHQKEPAAFDHDAHGNLRWGIRREGTGDFVPTMIPDAAPPSSLALKNKLISESLFYTQHWESLSPTSNGYPDVDTYRTMQFYIEPR